MNPPDLTCDEAAAALDDIQLIVAHTRRAIVAAHTAEHLIVWGVAWMLGFGAVQFTNWNPGLIWLPVGLVGGAFSAWIGVRAGRRVASPVAGRIFLFLAVLLGFAVAWLWILHPFNERNVGVYVATVFMFSYVAGGLWFGRFFVVLGVGVTALALAGVRLAPGWLDLIMGLGGGGALTASGLYIRRNWQPRGGT
jgi:hypothetical protein